MGSSSACHIRGQVIIRKRYLPIWQNSTARFEDDTLYYSSPNVFLCGQQSFKEKSFRVLNVHNDYRSTNSLILQGYGKQTFLHIKFANSEEYSAWYKAFQLIQNVVLLPEEIALSRAQTLSLEQQYEQEQGNCDRRNSLNRHLRSCLSKQDNAAFCGWLSVEVSNSPGNWQHCYFYLTSDGHFSSIGKYDLTGQISSPCHEVYSTSMPFCFSFELLQPNRKKSVRVSFSATSPQEKKQWCDAIFQVTAFMSESPTARTHHPASPQDSTSQRAFDHLHHYIR